MDVTSLKVTWVLLTVAALRINWARVIRDSRLVRFFEAVSTKDKRNFLNTRTPIFARFGHGVCDPIENVLRVVESLICKKSPDRPSNMTCPRSEPSEI